MQDIQGASRWTRLEKHHVEKLRDTLDNTFGVSLNMASLEWRLWSAAAPLNSSRMSAIG